MESSYLCVACQKSLPPLSFSKSQINKLQHKKIDSVRCTECTATAVVLVDGPSKPKDTKTEKPTEEKKPEVKQYDPSAQYIRNPRDTPIVKDAVAYATSKGLEYKVKLGPREGWRTVVKMAVRGVIRKNKKGKEHVITTIGLFKPGSHNVVACTDSKAHHPSINAALRAVEEVRASVDLLGYIEGSGYDGEDSDSAHYPNCYLKYVILVLARSTSKVQLSVVWNTEPKIHSAGEHMLTQFMTALLGKTLDTHSEHALFHSVWVNYNPSSRYNNAITGRGEDSWRLLFGDRYIKEVVRTDMLQPPTLLFPPFVFRQANICAFTNIIVNVRHWIKDMIKQRGESCTSSSSTTLATNKTNKRKAGELDPPIAVPDIKCVELYAGVGTIGLNCLDLFSELNCSDENPHNLACFEATRLNMQPESIRQRASYRSEGATAVAQSGGLQGFDLVIVDPPRKGLDDEVVQALLQYDHRSATHNAGNASQASRKAARLGTDDAHVLGAALSDTDIVRNNKRLIYVSCGFPAFKRDAARLIGPSTVAGSAEGGSEGLRYWKLVHLEGHILFPGSDHIETLAIFDRVV